MQENKMGVKPLLPLIIQMALPAIFSMLIQSLYNIVDSLYISRISEEALRAVTIAMPMQQLLIAVSIGTSVGVNSLIARSLGEKNGEKANQTAMHGLLLGVFNWLLFLVFALLFSRPYYSLFTHNAEVFTQGVSYLLIVYSFSFGVTGISIIEKTLQATGDMIRPMQMQLMGAVLNIVLDPILIFGLGPIPAMGVKGAAFATVLSQIIACTFALLILLKKEHIIQIRFSAFQFSREILTKIYCVGFPSILIISIPSAMMMSLNHLLRAISEQAISVMGIYFRLQSFVFMPVFGLTQGMMPIMGYNYGAKNIKRLKGTLYYGIGISCVIMAVGVVLFQVIPTILLNLFSATPEMLAIGVPALRIISLGFLFAGVNICFSTFYQALGMGYYSMIISLLRQLIVVVPLLWFFRGVHLYLMWGSFLIAEFATLLFCLLLYKKVNRDKLQMITPLL